MVHVRSDEVVARALAASDAGVPDAANAAAHGVAVKTIRRWRRIYQRRGLPRGHANTTVPCPRCTGAALDEAAYAELLGWYLGDGYISTRVVAGVRRRYDSPRWESINSSDDILDLCCWALDLCAVTWRRPRVNAVAVSRRDAVRLDELVGPKS